MDIRNIRHKGLRHFVLDGNGKGLPSEVLEKVGDMIDFLLVMESPDDLKSLPFWKPHTLSDGRISLTVTKNWRLTFGIDGEPPEIINLDYEDYH